jgi:DNA repair protein RecO (recombination protein O)
LASYLVELIDVMIAGRESGPETFSLLLHSLQVLEGEAVLPSLFLPAFELLLLTHTGYAPHLAGCQQCGLELLLDGEEAPSVFSPSLGGLLCSRCRGLGGAAMLVSAETLRLLRNAKVVDTEAFLVTTGSPRACRETRALMSSLLSRHLPRPLKSQAFLEQAGILSAAHVDDPRGE